MSNFQLQQEGQVSSTSVPNNFIENFMPTAAGEFVKIYIYLLKCVSENCSELSISRLADVFNNTEKDTKRALRYWEKKGLLKLSFNDDGSLRSLILTSAAYDQETVITRTAQDVPEVTEEESSAESAQEPTESVHVPEKKQYSRGELDRFSGSSENSMLIFVIQKLLGRVLTGSDVNTIMFMKDSLGFPEDLVEYVFEYCADKHKTSIRYIEKTAIAWAQQGIRDVNGARLINSIYSENCYPVMKAFGLTGRNPAADECRYIDTWVLSYGFSMDMILEACNRTISAIHQPSFEYADSILRRWKSAGISTLDQVKEADKEFSSRNSSKRGTVSAKIKKEPKAAAGAFNNFQQRTYDYDELEARLINK